jgi:hypothetical protein
MPDAPELEPLRVDVELRPEEIELAVAEAVTLVQALVERGRGPAYFRELARLSASVLEAEDLDELASRVGHRIDALAVVAWGLWTMREAEDLAEALAGIERSLSAL